MALDFLFFLLMIVFIFYIIFLFFLLFFYLSGFVSIISGAPYIPLSKKLIRKILSFGGLSSDDIFYDLGCGDGRILISGLSNFNVSKAVGYEIAPWPYLKTLFLSKYNQLKRIDLFRRDCSKADISQATFIYLYLFPKLIEKLADKIIKEGKPETKILCVEFPIDINNFTELRLLKSTKIDNLTIYLYEIKPHNLF